MYIDCVVQMRSNDAIFGYKNDYDWQCHILRQVCLYTDKLPGNIHWQVQNLHIYERHFKYLEN
jgi:thymidylate synthase